LNNYGHKRNKAAISPLSKKFPFKTITRSSIFKKISKKEIYAHRVAIIPK
jgi:hypothetical protein